MDEADKCNRVVHIDIEDTDDEMLEVPTPQGDLELDEDFLKIFCRKASTLFFLQYGLISHQINSYNEFIKTGIQDVFDSMGTITVEPSYDPSKKAENEWKYASVKFGKVSLERPSFSTGKNFSEVGGEFPDFLPRHARLQNMTYSSRMMVQIQFQVYTQELVSSDKFETGIEKYIEKKVISDNIREINIGRIPVMVKSDLCWMNGVEKDDCDFDQGGYFIIKGAEKTFIAQEQACLNRIWVDNSPSWMAKYRSTIRRQSVYVKLVDAHTFEHAKGVDLVISVYLMSLVDIPIWILFYALGVSSDKEIVNLITADIEDGPSGNILIASIYDADQKCEDFRNRRDALKFIDKIMQNSVFPPKESVSDCIRNNLFPSLSGFRRKAHFLGYMVKCLLEAYTGRRKVDCRDDMRNKRLELASELLKRELRIHLKHAERRMVKAMQRDLYGDQDLKLIECYLDASIITNGLSRAFSTGAWSHPYKCMQKISGVVATVRRTNPLQMMADMRRSCQKVLYAGKAGGARYPHPSHWGKICFLSTPDGENCGLVKNLACSGLVSTTVRENFLDILQEAGMKKLADDTSTLLSEVDKVFIDGEWVGICEDSAFLVAELRSKRQGKKVPHQVEIKRDVKHREVRIFCDAGRIMRPLLVVRNLTKFKLLKGGRYSFLDLLDNGVMELIGPEEEEDCRIAWEVKYLFLEENPPMNYTHCELDMSFLLGLSCGMIPFANHDHAKRVLFQSQKHSNQAIGFSTTNPNIRVDTLSHQLFYPQRPLFRTMLTDCLEKPGSPNFQKGMLPRPEFYNGQCAIVAVNVHLGYNQEDSVVMNQASAERGMFRSEHIRSYKADVDNIEAQRRKPAIEKFGKIQSRIGRVDSLDDDGFPFIGANLKGGDTIIGKHTESGVDHSIKLNHTERGMVQKVVLSANDDGKNFAVVSLRQVRSPCPGDKFSSMHGQKGVLGFLDSQENFPFTLQGIVPDIVINPHAFPSRQTPGQILEGALGKGIALGGTEKYATPFSTLSVDVISDQLHRAGFSRWGNERVYNGATGEMVKSLIFMGPTFYQRLNHMSEDKVKFRNTGPVNPLTRQPVLDRKRFGGVKFGEMERDCLIAHGASINLHERLCTLSDLSQMHVCRKCTNMVPVIERTICGGHKVRGPYCRFCESLEEVVKVDVPYGAKLLCQELFSMGICLKFETELC